MNLDWMQDEGDDWIVLDVDTGVLYGRFKTEGEALRIVDEFAWSGQLPAPLEEQA